MQQARTKEEKQELVQLYKQSGMSARAFADELKLNYGTFRTWLYKKQPEPKPADDNLNGTTGTVASNVDGVELTVDATTGKLQARSSDAQLNAGAIIKVPVKNEGSVVTVVSYPGYHYYTVAGTAANADTTTYTVIASDVSTGYVEIVATNTAYLYSISLTNPL